MGSNNLNASDTWVRTQLAALNPLYPGDQSKILVRRDDQATTADADNKDLVVISSTVNSGNVGTKFRDVQVPVLLWERHLYDEMRMTTGGNHGETDVNQRRVIIANINHPLRGNVETGNQIVYESDQRLNWGIPNGNAVAIASLTGGGNSGYKVIFGYPANVGMIGGFVAPARRVGFFLSDNGADNLDPRGRILFANAVIWARGN